MLSGWHGFTPKAGHPLLLSSELEGFDPPLEHPWRTRPAATEEKTATATEETKDEPEFTEEVKDATKAVKDFAAQEADAKKSDEAFEILQDVLTVMTKESEADESGEKKREIDDKIVGDLIKCSPSFYFDLKDVVSTAATDKAEDDVVKNGKEALDAVGASSRTCGCGPEVDSFMGFRLGCGIIG